MANPTQLIPGPVHRSSPAKIHAITSVRFFAALYVVFFHITDKSAQGAIVDRFLDLGYVSVAFFFLLSGYILSAVYLRKGKPIDLRSFYVARFARIYPLYIVSVLMDAPFAVASRVAQYGLAVALGRVGVLLAASTSMMQIFIPTPAIVNIPSWSLGIEAVFYLCFPFLGVWLWKLRDRALILTATLLYIGSVALNWKITQFRPEHITALDLPSYTAIFALGILVARWQFAPEEPLVRSHPSGLIAWSIQMIAILAFAGAIYAAPWLGKMHVHPGLLLAPVFAAQIWILSSSNILPVRLLKTNFLVVLGEASYGLYLIHVPIRHFFIRLHLTQYLWGSILYFVVCIGLSVLSFYFFETPTRKWIMRKFHTRTKESIEAASDA